MTNYTRIVDSLRDNPCESAAEAIERLQAERSGIDRSVRRLRSTDERNEK